MNFLRKRKQYAFNNCNTYFKTKGNSVKNWYATCDTSLDYFFIGWY